MGRVRDPAVAALCAELLKRLRPYHHVEIVEVRTGSIAQESAAILRTLAPSDHVWLLDRSGEQFASEELAQRLEALATAGISSITFAIGGAFGTDPSVAARANARWSLSPLTFLHEWTRAIVLEQLYRAAKIARNEPYHH